MDMIRVWMLQMDPELKWIFAFFPRCGKQHFRHESRPSPVSRGTSKADLSILGRPPRRPAPRSRCVRASKQGREPKLPPYMLRLDAKLDEPRKRCRQGL